VTAQVCLTASIRIMPAKGGPARGPAQRRRVQGSCPAYRRQVRAPDQTFELPATERPPVTERTVVRSGPQTMTGGDADDDPTGRRQDPVDFLQRGGGIVAFLQHVHGEDALEHGIAQRQRDLVAEKGPVWTAEWPGLHALARGHPGHDPARAPLERVDEGGGVAEGQDIEARAVAPRFGHLARHHSARHRPQRAGVERPQFEDTLAQAGS
jgi:hypothetical protein